MPARARPSPSAIPATLGPTLVRWYRRHRRPLPWRRSRDPYRIWVAEVVLQQTRVAQAVPYFERFVREFPTVRALAEAPLDRVLKVWEGAGYYARARHLHAAARVLVREHAGHLPRTMTELEELPGVGPYIARSVAALAFGVRTVALEANGRRVGARWTRSEGDVRRGAAQRAVESALATAMERVPPGEFAEAVMELGETVCRPAAPDCGHCPVAFGCRAHRELDDPSILPFRPKRARRSHVRAAIAAVHDRRGRWLFQRRPPRGLLGGLWELPGGKIRRGESPRDAAARELNEETGARAVALVPVGVVRHAYSHFSVELHVFEGPVRSPAPRARDGRRWVTRADARRLALPKATRKALALLVPARPGRASRGSGSRPGRTRA